jgi:phosphatidylethanolamine-binding protein (PEBP) family uncharacterized protein
MSSSKLIISVASIFLGFVGVANAKEFKISFDWGGLKLCTSGQPNIVANPRFKVSGLPKGTKFIQFRLEDKNVPGYPHGGGWVEMSNDGRVPSNSFKYQSPCPPSGQHVYEWTAVAKDKKGFGAKKLGTAKAARKYPE